MIECLLHLRGRDSIRSRISDCLSEAEILFRCGLFRPAIERLNGAKALALRHEQTACLLLIRQTELQYLSTEDFQEISEKQLVEKQMKVNVCVAPPSTCNSTIFSNTARLTAAKSIPAATDRV